MERPSDIVIAMNTDERWQSITNSCWEIQQVRPLHGGPVVLNGLYRFKHIATERYLSLDIEGRVNLVLRARSPSQYVDTLFILRPLNQEQELDDDDEIEGHEIYHGTKFYLETAYSTFLQVYQKIEDDAGHLFTYKDRTKHEFYTMLRSGSLVSVVAGAKQLTCEEGEPKMVFELELVPKRESQMAFKALGFTTAVKRFYNFLNDWGVGPAPESIKSVDTLCFSNDAAVEGERELVDRVAFLMSNLADVREILQSAESESGKQLRRMQSEL